MIIERDYCTRCKGKENLMTYSKHVGADGNTIVYKLCRPCNAEKHKAWYDNGNQKKAQINNRRYRLRNYVDLQ